MGMIDIHCHILPGIDDGAKSEAELLKMAHEAVSDGITTIIATPHHMNGVYINAKAEVLALTEHANQLLQKEEIPLTILPSQEIRIYENLIRDLRNNQVLFLDKACKYILLELPANSVPYQIDRLIFEIQILGVTPIIAHPERNSAIREQPYLLYKMVKSGAFAQLTAASITGRFGKEIEKFSRQLVEHQLVHLIASDAHNADTRGPRLVSAYERLAEYGGRELADEFKRNAENVVNGKGIWAGEPMKIQKKKLFGLF